MDSTDLKGLVMNPEIIGALYKNEPFSLSALIVMKVHLNIYNRTAFIHADLDKFPNDPPKKWIVKKYNTAQIALQVIDIENFKCDGLFRDNEKARIEIVKQKDRLVINLFTNDVYLTIDAGWIQIDKIEGYQKIENAN